jgi:hypothetical protein
MNKNCWRVHEVRSYAITTTSISTLELITTWLLVLKLKYMCMRESKKGVSSCSMTFLTLISQAYQLHIVFQFMNKYWLELCWAVNNKLNDDMTKRNANLTLEVCECAFGRLWVWVGKLIKSKLNQNNFCFCWHARNFFHFVLFHVLIS